MGFINLLLAISPIAEGDMPSLNFIGQFLRMINDWTGNICWTMILFTLVLKLVTFPLDYISRKSMKKNQMIQEMLAPELEKLEIQCKGDKNLYNQKMMARMKKEGYSMSGACLPTLLTLGLFFVVFSAINSFATFSNASTYNALVDTYNQETAGLSTEEIADKQTEIDAQLVAVYKESNPSWLWIKNPLRPDTWVGAIPTFNEITTNSIGLTALKIPGSDTLARSDYGELTRGIRAEYGDSWNGFLVLPVLAMLSSFFSQWIMQKTQPQPQAAAGGAGMTKFMMYFFPLLMVYFSVQYTSSFAIYIVSNSMFMLASTFLINVIVTGKLKKEFAEKKKLSYDRR